MTVELPYEIGTVVKNTKKNRLDKIAYYIIRDKIQVILLLNYKSKENSSFSSPIYIEEFLSNWTLEPKSNVSRNYTKNRIPKIDDNIYENKFPTTYTILNMIRMCHYKYFGYDLSFNGDKNLVYFGCAETRVDAYKHTCKNFANTKDKKPVLTVYLEKGTLNNKDNYVGFKINISAIESEKDKVLKFINECIFGITGRGFNLVISREEYLYFLHVPFERKMHYKEDYYLRTKNTILYTYEEFIFFIIRLYDNQYFCINMISDEIISRLNNDEIEFIECTKKLALSLYSKDFSKLTKIKVSPGLSDITFEN